VRVLSIYSDRSFLATDATPHAAVLAPFWGPNPEPPGDPSRGRFDRFVSRGRSFLRLTTLEECDVGVFPQDWQGVEKDEIAIGNARRFARACAAAAKPMVVFHWTDADEPADLDAFVFTTSLLRSRRRPREFALPAWSEDFVERYAGGRLPVRRRGARPVVGFCGQSSEPATAPTTRSGRLRRSAGARKRALLRRAGRLSSGHVARARALDRLTRDRSVTTNFVVRDDFWAGAIPGGVPDPAALRRARREYVANMVASDYILCARGDGNFSYRLYETLSCGRIPVFVDTDCVLPLDFELDWRRYCVWVDESELEQIGEKVAAFHEGLRDAGFADLQRECRRLWETHLSPEGFFAHLRDHF
jgi:hypothetical protein